MSKLKQHRKHLKGTVWQHTGDMTRHMQLCRFNPDALGPRARYLHLREMAGEVFMILDVVPKSLGPGDRKQYDMLWIKLLTINGTVAYSWFKADWFFQKRLA